MHRTPRVPSFSTRQVLRRWSQQCTTSLPIKWSLPAACHTGSSTVAGCTRPWTGLSHQVPQYIRVRLFNRHLRQHNIINFRHGARNLRHLPWLPLATHRMARILRHLPTVLLTLMPAVGSTTPLRPNILWWEARHHLRMATPGIKALWAILTLRLRLQKAPRMPTVASFSILNNRRATASSTPCHSMDKCCSSPIWSPTP
mmetsp:Transcript_9843/g.24246  ORF Transcript_9843/g.24246 Transcript_9843/m.24246 type:complete len:200 (-) Transcript_9843:76-675(-)